jgi:hypothetical protein
LYSACYEKNRPGRVIDFKNKNVIISIFETFL